MAYIRQWRKYHAQVDALAQSSSDEQEILQSSSDNEGCAGLSSSPADAVHGLDKSDSFSDDYESYESTGDSDSEDDDNGVHYDDDNEVQSVSDLGADLANWATRNKSTRSALNELLDILRKQGLRLPKDARTLLQTPRIITTIQKCGGEYLYFGLESGILKVISEHLEYFRRNREVLLTFNIDGVPLFKSSNVQLWPILCSVKNFEPFVVAIYCGDTKPNSVQEYLNDFLDELANLEENGTCIEEDNFQVTVLAFVCDAPARSFLKCTKGHTAYYACERCIIKGTWNGRVVFNIDNNVPALRSERSFNNLEYKDHQTSKSPLIDAGLSCIKAFPLDYMHLVCLGIVKRSLMFIKQGPRECRLSHQQVLVLSSKLSTLKGKMPREFARQPRSILFLDKWKATEFRQFLLYTGPVVLKSAVPDRLYKHFLTLTVAISILLNSNEDFRNSHLEYARELLLYFVKTSKLVYGDTFVSYNVHSLLHIPDDVEHFGMSLNEISAFPFENHLQKLKKSVRKGQNPIAQVAKRITELEKSKCRRAPRKSHHCISVRKKDSCFLLKNNRFAFVKEKRLNRTYVCDVVSLQKLDSFFMSPCDSKLLNIAVLRNNRGQYKRMLISQIEFEKKVVCIPYERGYLLVPMLHEIERW